METDNYSVLARKLIYKIAANKPGNMQRAKLTLDKELTNVGPFINRFIEVCREELNANNKYIKDDKKSFLSTSLTTNHILNCQLIASRYQAELARLADTKMNRKYVFDSLVYDCWFACRQYHARRDEMQQSNKQLNNDIRKLKSGELYNGKQQT